MEKYIEELFGTRVKIEKWDDYKKLPYYLVSDRQFYVMQIGSFQCILMKIQVIDFSVSAFIKQRNQLEKYTEKQIVLWFDKISSYQRKVLLKNHISFIVPDSQLYIPELGMSFKEQFVNKRSFGEKMTAVAQVLVLFLIYSTRLNFGKKAYTQSELASELKLSAMNVSRGVQELEEFGLISTEKDGRNKKVIPVIYGKKLYERAKEYMQSPIQKKIYVLNDEVYNNLPSSGEEALAQKTMLNSPKYHIKAIDKKEIKNFSKKKMVDPKWETDSNYIELELWKYDPALFAKECVVDIISLTLSLKELGDERIEEQIEEMWKEYEW